ncbi:hypothetical protein [Sphingomonas oryzagri]
MSDPVIGAVIVRHIDELEAALRYAHNSMRPMLARAVAAVMEDKRLALTWAGEVVPDFDETLWLAPEEWRIVGDPEDNEFYLSFSLETTPSIDGSEPETWVGIIAGFAGAGIKFAFGTDALRQREWKALLKAQGSLLVELVDRGFRCDPKTGDLELTIPIGRDALAMGFEEDTLEAALSPLGQAIDRIDAARPILDRLVAAIKATSA